MLENDAKKLPSQLENVQQLYQGTADELKEKNVRRKRNFEVRGKRSATPISSTFERKYLRFYFEQFVRKKPRANSMTGLRANSLHVFLRTVNMAPKDAIKNGV